MRRLRGWFSLCFMFCSQEFVCECGVCCGRCGESAVGSAEMVVGSGVCVAGCGGCRSQCRVYRLWHWVLLSCSGGFRSGTGVFVYGIGVFEVDLFRFRVVKRKRTPCGVPKNKNEKIKYRFYEPFSFVSFSACAWCKGSVFFVCSGEKLVFFAVFNRCFPCLRGGFRGFSGSFRRKWGLVSWVCGFQMRRLRYLRKP